MGEGLGAEWLVGACGCLWARFGGFVSLELSKKGELRVRLEGKGGDETYSKSRGHCRFR